MHLDNGGRATRGTKRGIDRHGIKSETRRGEPQADGTEFGNREGGSVSTKEDGANLVKWMK